jgi:hypothetical protein
LRVRRIRLREISYSNYLCDEFKNSRYPLPDNIRRSRNTAIRLGFFEIFSCIAFIEFYEARRSRIVLGLLLTTWVTTAIGFYSKLRLSYYGLLFHACYTLSVLGGFYIYVIVDILFASDSHAENEGALGEKPILLLTSMPMLCLFLMGIYSLVLVLKLDEELEARKKADNGEAAYDYNRVEQRGANSFPPPQVVNHQDD